MDRCNRTSKREPQCSQLLTDDQSDDTKLAQHLRIVLHFVAHGEKPNMATRKHSLDQPARKAAPVHVL
jgi:hypothetical protein